MFRYTAIFLSAIVFLAAPPGLWAGWVQMDRDGVKTLIQDGKIKEVPEEAEEAWLVMDLNNSRVLMHNPADNTCSESTFDEYCQTVQVFVEAMKKAMEAFAGAGMQGEKPPAVKVVRQGSGGMVAGFETVRYQVFADDELHEEVWLTEDKQLLKERGNMDSFMKLTGCLEKVATSVEDDPVYRKMIASGWVLKEITYGLGGPEVTEAVSLEKKDIPASEFTLPEGCRKVDMQSIMEGE